MKCPRFSLSGMVFAILILAIDLAVVRNAIFNGRPVSLSLFAFLLLPMLDALLIVLFRLRKPERRTTRSISFLITGTAATFFLFLTCALAPEAVLRLLRIIGRLIALASMNGMARLFGNAVMQHWTMQLAFGITFEVLFPIALFCLPPLLIAFVGRWIASRLERVPQVAVDGPGGSDSLGAII